MMAESACVCYCLFAARQEYITALQLEAASQWQVLLATNTMQAI